MSLPLNTDWQGSRGGLASASASVVNRGVGRPDAFVGGGSTMPPVPSPAAASFVAPARVAGVAGASSRDGDVDLLHNRTPVTWRRMWLQYRFSAILVVFTLVAVLFVYHFLSDGDFSFLMTLSSMMSVLSVSILVLKRVQQGNLNGISLKTLQAFAAVRGARLVSILLHEGYLPFDKSGDWFYQLCEVLVLLLVGVLLAFAFTSKRSQLDVLADTFPTSSLSSKYGFAALGVPCLVLAMLLHPSLNSSFILDTCWTFALYLEAVAILPQLRMFHELRDKEVEMYTSTWVFSHALAALFSFVFWLASYHELNDRTHSMGIQGYLPGILVVLSQVIGVLLVVDYMYMYIMTARSGRPMLLPQTV